MAQYTVQAPDGKTITLEGPAGASQADILAQAKALYTPKAAPTARPKPAAPTRRGPDPKTQKFLEQYNQIRGGITQKLPDARRREMALQKFDSDPRAQRLRQLAGLAPLSTRKGDVQAIARKSVDKVYREAGGRAGKDASWLQSIIAGASKGFFGLPQHGQAAIYSALPSKLTGIPKGATYSNILETIRGRDDAAIDANFWTGGLPGEIAGGLAGSGLAGSAVKAGARTLATRGAPAIARIGNVLQNLTTLNKGQKLANAGKIAVIGGTAGAAQAAGTGGSVGEGAAIGAIGAPAVLGGVKVAQIITRPFRDVLQLSSAGQILSRLTTATREQMERRAAAYRQATGAEPTLFELLPLADRNKILKTAVVGKDNVVEQTSDAIRARARNLGPEMSARARQVLEPNRTAIQAGIRTDLANARGGALAAGDDDLIEAAMESPTDMLRLRDEEARAIMAPHEATPIVPNLEDLFPSVPASGGARKKVSPEQQQITRDLYEHLTGEKLPEGYVPDIEEMVGASKTKLAKSGGFKQPPKADSTTRIGVDPEVAAVIRSAAGTLRARAPGAGVTAGDITDMISTLRGDLAKGGIEGRNAERAINHLQDTLDDLAPDAGAAARRMSDAYAARSRMAEGMAEGNATRLRDDVQVGTSRRQARTIRNAYDSPEGGAGRTLGQGNRIISDLGGSPEEALRATVKQSRGSTGRQLAQNVGPVEADLLAAAARAQDESAQALASASQKAQGGSGEGADAEMLVQAIAGLHPASFITTKAGAMRKLLDMTYIPENRARTIVDMLFSQDPAMSARALRAIGSQPNGAQFVKSLAVLVGQGGAAISDGEDGEDGPAMFAADTPSVEDDLMGLDEESEIPVPDVGDSPYGEALQNVYANENPELIELVQRVKGQESGGQQFDENGNPLQSSAGAIGIMQVMPETAPEAAQLAGLPWDENAYRTDAAYNELLGIAYLSEMLRKYDGDVERALAAYNAGPGRVDDALSMHDASWLSNLPGETQDYVARVG